MLSTDRVGVRTWRRTGRHDGAMTESPAILKARTGADPLAMLPLLAGGPLSPGIAIAPFSGNRTPAVLRHPLPRTAKRSELQAIAGALLGMISKLGGCDAVAIAIYTDDPFDVALDTWTELEKALVERFLTAGFGVKDTFCVASDGWACFGELEKRELGEITDSPLNRQWAKDVPPSRVFDGTLPGTDAAVVAEVQRTLDELTLGFRVDAFGIAHPYDAADPISLLEQALEIGADGVGPQRLAELVLAVQREGDFDRVVTQVCLGPDRAADVWAATLALREKAARRGRQPIELMLRERRRRESKQNLEIGRLLTGLECSRPDDARVRAAIEVLARATAHAPRDLRPTTLCVLAWLHWALGLGTSAGRLLQAASDIDPHHDLTAIVHAIIVAVMVPHWTLTRDLRDATAECDADVMSGNRGDHRARRRRD